MRLSKLWRNLVHRPQIERDLDDEVRAALDLLVDENIQKGMTLREARRAAALEFGGVEAIKDGVRDRRAGAWIDAFLWDLRYAGRLLARNPVFAATAALSLAIGIGATTTIFTVANGLLLRAAPGVADPDRLVDISRTDRDQPMANPLMGYREYLDLRGRVTTLDGLYANQGNLEPLSLATGGDIERIFATIVTANYFEVLGIKPAAGRLFTSRDSEEPGASPLVVLSHAFWTRRFKGDPAILGQTLELNGDRFAVIGVAPENFWGTSVVSSDVWLLIGTKPFDKSFFAGQGCGGGEWGMVGGRLKAGISRAQAAAELDAIGAALEREYSQCRGRGFLVARASPIPPALRFVLAGFLGLLMALVALVLVIACANVAGVLLARAAARRREIAVRTALGAGRGRLVRQLLTETLLLFLIGGSVGLLLARGMTTLLLKLLPAFPVPVALSLPLDGGVLVFAMGISLVAAVLSGLAPALHVSKADVVTGLKAETQGPSDRLRLRSAFVVIQVAFSILLVVAAGVLGRAMGRAVTANQAFDAENLEAASIDLSQFGYTETTGTQFARELLDRLRAMPAVKAATLADQIPLRAMFVGPMRVPGVTPPDERGVFRANWNTVDVGYFETLGVGLVAGRDFQMTDRAGTQPVAIISAAGAAQLWPGEDPIGKFIQWPALAPASASATTTFQIVGVVPELRPGSLAVRERGPRGSDVAEGRPAAPVITAYVPLQQRYKSQLTILVRMASGQNATRAIGAAAASLNPRLSHISARRLDEQDGPVQVQLRVAASVAGSVGLIGVLLAAMGIYGVTAHAVTQRTREIGIRIAMGAERRDLIAMVLGRSMALVAIGAIIGLVLSASGGRLLTRFLSGAPPIDPIVFAGATLLFALVGLAASYLPVRRAIRINAVEALRYE